MKKENKNEIVIYKSKNGPELRIDFREETFWLTQDQIAVLFGVQRPAITKHLRNIFISKELNENSVSSILEHTASDGKNYKVKFYNLDVVLSIGYRINSLKATQFRIWANRILKEYLVKGYTVNEKRLLETKETFSKLQQTISFLKEKSEKELLAGQGKDILDLLSSYSRTLTILDEYDKGTLARQKSGIKTKFKLEYEDCLKVITEIKHELTLKNEAGDIFGSERDGSFQGIIRGLYQTFGGKELYATLEIKAAHVLYLIIKDHPFSDGNKRTGSFLFVYFLDKNNALYRESGEKKINDNALAALALLVAESNPDEKEVMISLITQLLK